MVIRNLMSRLVDTSEAIISILAHLAVLRAVDEHGLVAGGGEGGAVGVFDG